LRVSAVRENPKINYCSLLKSSAAQRRPYYKSLKDLTKSQPPQRQFDVGRVQNIAAFVASWCALKLLQRFSQTDSQNDLLDKRNKLPSMELVERYKTQDISDSELVTFLEKYPEKLPYVDYKFFVNNKVPLTKHDTPEILQTRLETMNATSCQYDSEEFLQNKKRVLSQEIEKIKKVPAEQKLVFITGLSGAGKSHYISENYSENYYVADVDLIKKEFPSYETSGKRLNTLHEVSKLLLHGSILPTALISGKNVVMPTTGLSDFVKRIAIPAKNLGYTVEVRHIEVSKEKAMQNVVERFERDGRFVDPYFVLKRAQKMQEQPQIYEKAKYVDNVVMVDQENL